MKQLLVIITIYNWMDIPVHGYRLLRNVCLGGSKGLINSVQTKFQSLLQKRGARKSTLPGNTILNHAIKPGV